MRPNATAARPSPPRPPARWPRTRSPALPIPRSQVPSPSPVSPLRSASQLSERTSAEQPAPGYGKSALEQNRPRTARRPHRLIVARSSTPERFRPIVTRPASGRAPLGRVGCSRAAPPRSFWPSWFLRRAARRPRGCRPAGRAGEILRRPTAAQQARGGLARAPAAPWQPRRPTRRLRQPPSPRTGRREGGFFQRGVSPLRAVRSRSTASACCRRGCTWR